MNQDDAVKNLLLDLDSVDEGQRYDVRITDAGEFDNGWVKRKKTTYMQADTKEEKTNHLKPNN